MLRPPSMARTARNAASLRDYPTRTFFRGMRTATMTEHDFSSLRINQDRFMKTLHETCRFGTGLRWGHNPTDTGMARLALTDADKQVRDWFVETVKSLGCTVTVDAMGNIFAVRPGRKKEAAPIYAGSHLDTQPAAGRYDGILGVVAGVEILKLMKEREVETEFPVGVVNWTNEEGARFPMSMMSSGVWAGAIPIERAYACQAVGECAGRTVRAELERIGYLGSTPASHTAMPISAHFELHIEQGPILESEQKKIGVVQGVQAYRWYTIDVKGRAAHTGTTPYPSRADALLLAARLITHSHRVSVAHSALASTGILTLEPGSTNTIPSSVRFSLDIRNPDEAVVARVEEQLKHDFAFLATGQEVAGDEMPSAPGLPLEVEWTTDFVSKGAVFHRDTIACVRDAASSALGGEGRWRHLSSGAGHDSVYTSKHCPTSMIFVPSRNGVSHHPEEWTSPEDCTLGAEVLCQSMLRYDRFLELQSGAN